MKLSNKKIKHIKRNAGVKSCDQIAAELGIRLKDVESVLNTAVSSPDPPTDRGLNAVLRWWPVGLVLAAPFVFINGIYDFANLPQTAFIQIGIVLFAFLWLMKCLRNRTLSIPDSPATLPVLLFVGWALVSAAYAHNRYEVFITWTHWSICALGYITMISCCEPETLSNRIPAVLVISGGLTAVLGIYQHLSGVSPVPQVVPPAAVFANKNMASHYIVLTFPLVLGWFFNTRRTLWNWLLPVQSALMLVFAFYTQTRAGWLALLVETAIFAVMMIRDKVITGHTGYWNPHKIMASAVALVIICIMVNIGPQGFKWGFGEIAERASSITDIENTSVTSAEPYSSVSQRLDIWRNTAEMIKDHFWFGVGLGNHKLHYPLYHRKVVREQTFSEQAQLRNVHNDFLQIFSELGIVGMAFIGWLAWSVLRMTWVLTSRETDQHIRIRTIGIITAIAGLSVNACFSFPLHRALPPFVLMALVSILASQNIPNLKRIFSTQRTGIMILCTMGLLATGIYLGCSHYNGIQCDRHYLNVTRLEKLKNWDGVISESRLATLYNPERVQILSYMGRALIEKGNNAEGIKALSEVVRAYPNHMNALLNLGVGYSNIDDFDNALKTFNRVLEIKPDYAKVHNNLGNLYMKRKQADMALKEFRDAAALEPENSFVHYNIGIVEMQTNHFPEAATALETALKLRPDWDMAHKYLGIVYIQFLNQPDKGLPHLKKALSLNPDITDADKMRMIVEQLGRK